MDSDVLVLLDFEDMRKQRKVAFPLCRWLQRAKRGMKSSYTSVYARVRVSILLVEPL